MKKIISLLLCVMIMCCACGNSNEFEKAKLEQSQVRNIAELATLECYYHNVAKTFKEGTSGWWFWEKDTHFWIEYEGIVKMGVDASKITMNVKGEKVYITMPKAKLLSAKVNEETLNEKSFIIASDSTKPSSEDQTKAIKEAQEEMESEAKQDSMLLANAQSQAQSLIEKYVKNIGNIIGQTYVVEWKYLGEK